MSVHPTLLAAAFGVALTASPGLARAQDDAHGFGDKPSQWFVVANGGAGGREVLTLSLQNGVVTGVDELVHQRPGDLPGVGGPERPLGRVVEPLIRTYRAPRLRRSCR